MRGWTRGAPPPPAGEGSSGKRRPSPRTASSGRDTAFLRRKDWRGAGAGAHSGGAAQEAACMDGRTEKWTWVPSTQPRCRQSSPADITACPTATLQPPPECRRCPPAQVPAVRQSAPTAAPPSNDTHLVRLQVQSFPVPSLQLKSLQ